MADGSFPQLVSKNDDLNSAENPIHAEISQGGNAVSSSNPIPVEIIATQETITKVHDYKTATVQGNGTSENHDYAVAGTKFRLKKVLVASTGKVKFSIQVGPVASLQTKAVVFTNTNENFHEVVFDPPIDVLATGTGTVRVIRQQNQTGSNDVYSTIIGEDVA